MTKQTHPFVSHLATPEARFAAMRSDWPTMLARERTEVVAANTFAPSLTTQFLVDGAITKLQDRLAALKCFTRDFTTDPLKPIAIGNLKFVTGTDGVVQINPASFESGDSTVADVSITPAHISRAFHVTDAELNSGLRMENLLDINLAVFANALIQIATALITVANFGGQTPIVRAPGNFGWGEMETAFGQLKKSPIKNAVLDGEYLARIINVPFQFQKSGVEPGPAWARYGWDNIALNTNWTGADPNVRGFLCHPQAIGLLAGLPVASKFGAGSLDVSTFTVPGIDISVAVYKWFSLATRTLWYSFDLMIGATVLDSTAGIIVKSA